MKTFIYQAQIISYLIYYKKNFFLILNTMAFHSFNSNVQHIHRILFTPQVVLKLSTLRLPVEQANSNCRQ